jgi:hypothetical protein
MQAIYMDIEELKKRRESLVNSIFILMIQIAFIFAIPAIAAILAGKYLDEGKNTFYVPLFLFISFVTSWVAVIWLYKNKTKKLNEVESLIKEAAQKDKQNV